MRNEAAAGDRYGYWFPLVLLGFLLLGLLGLESVRSSPNFGWFAYQQPGQQFVSVEQHSLVISSGTRRYSDYAVMSFDLWQYPSRDWRWAVLVLATFIATVTWYGWRAHRAGAASVRPFVLLAVGGGLAIAVGYVLAAWAGTVPNPSELVTSVGLPLAVLGVVAGVWAYLRLGPGRRWAAIISLVCLVAGTCAVLGSQAPLLVDPVIITSGLLGLAWFERSRLLAFVAVAVLAGMAVFPEGVLSMLVPAMLLLGGAITALGRAVVVLRASPR